MAASTNSPSKIPPAVLGRLRIPMLVVDRSSVVLYANAAASSVTEHDGPFQTVNKTLVARNRADNVQLQRAITNASANGASETLMIVNHKMGRTQFVSVSPLHDGDVRVNDALVIVQKFGMAEEAFSQSLRELFRLSPSESAIAASLAKGEHAESIAEARSAKVATVRAQITAIMFKTRTRRQVELVALLSQLASMP